MLSGKSAAKIPLAKPGPPFMKHAPNTQDLTRFGPISLIQKVLSFEVGSMFQSKSSANIFTLASCSLPLVILVGMFTFPLACGLFIMQWVCSVSSIK